MTGHGPGELFEIVYNIYARNAWAWPWQIYGLEKMITTSQALLEETRFGCVTKASYMHLNISKLRNCYNSCASNHRPIFDSNGQAWFGVGAGAGDTYVGRRLARTNAASANDYVRSL